MEESEPSIPDVCFEEVDTPAPAIHVGGGSAFGCSTVPGQTGVKDPVLPLLAMLSGVFAIGRRCRGLDRNTEGTKN